MCKTCSCIINTYLHYTGTGNSWNSYAQLDSYIESNLLLLLLLLWQKLRNVQDLPVSWSCFTRSVSLEISRLRIRCPLKWLTMCWLPVSSSGLNDSAASWATALIASLTSSDTNTSSHLHLHLHGPIPWRPQTITATAMKTWKLMVYF